MQNVKNVKQMLLISHFIIWSHCDTTLLIKQSEEQLACKNIVIFLLRYLPWDSAESELIWKSWAVKQNKVVLHLSFKKYIHLPMQLIHVTFLQ